MSLLRRTASNAGARGWSYTAGMTLELRQLRYLLALAEQGSLGRAAAALAMTQPALTRGLQQLEREVGAVLFERSKKGVAATDEGRVLVARAREVVAIADALDRDLLRKEPSHVHVTLGAGPYPAETIVPGAVARCVARNPMTHVRVVIREWDELLRMLRKREIAFFVAETSTLDNEADLAIERCPSHPVYFVARRGHPLARRRAVRAADTYAYPMLALTRSPPRVLGPMLAARPAAAAGPSRPVPAIELASVAAAQRVLVASDAIAPLTLSCVGDALERGILTVLGGEPWLHVNYGIVALNDQRMGAMPALLQQELQAEEAALATAEAALAARHVRPRRENARR
ncbi:MAG: LysR family transcriptional regulator [Proteobacteria bacterium]|nr:LysR family transcriptional regulator [Pseudomonadota bacterium]